MEQVLVRKRQAHGNLTVLTLATVLSENGDSYRLKISGQAAPEEVKKAAVLPVHTVMGQVRVDKFALVPTKSAGAPYSLSRR